MLDARPQPSRLLRTFRAVAFAEGCSFLLLLGVAMPLKHAAGMPQAVAVVGLAHGALFLAYLAIAALVFGLGTWPLGRVPGALLAAVLPFGTFVMERAWMQPDAEG